MLLASEPQEVSVKKIAALAALSMSLLVSHSAFASAPKKAAVKHGEAKASAGDCTRAMENMYKLAGLTPNADAKKDNIAKCKKEKTQAETTCMTNATTMEQLGACAPAK